MTAPTTPPDNAGLAERLRRASGLSLWFEDTGTTTVALDIGPLCAEAADYIEALRPSVWMDIRTAPKDGTKVLAWADGEVVIVSFRKRWAKAPEAEWMEATGECYEGYIPTHWQPLPSAPTPPKAPTP